MKILVTCEYSGKVREAFRKKGHRVTSCDILPSDDNSPFHIQGDVLPLLEYSWDLIVAHPPCTYLCNSGVRWLYESKDKQGNLLERQRYLDRWVSMYDACNFFMAIAKADCPKIAIENPVMHGHARKELVKQGIGSYGYNPDGKPSFTCQPYNFGDPERKRTCFWTKGLPPLKHTSDLTREESEQSIWKQGPGKDRWKIRSKTFQGIADAIADQWGDS